jgi:glycosyltransferase involved in cell wall biosynthesis
VPWTYRQADAIVAVSHEVAADLERFARLPDGSVQAIYNPFDLERMWQLGAAARHPWFAPGSRRGAGDRAPDRTKGFPTLLRAFAALRPRRFAHLLILGEGELRGELETLMQNCGLTADDVQMPGFVTNPFAYLARCALLSCRHAGKGCRGC